MSSHTLYTMLFQKRTLLYGTILLIIGISIGLVVHLYQLHEQRGKVAVKILTVPHDAIVTLNGRHVRQGTAYIAAGIYTAEIHKDGFASHKTNLHVSDHTMRPLYVALRPESDEATRWAARNQHAYAKLERLAAQSSAAYGQSFQAKWPIVKTLPIKDPYFNISYVHHDDETISLKISGTSPRYRMLALQHLRSRGFDPTEYNIEFTGFQHPLTKEVHHE